MRFESPIEEQFWKALSRVVDPAVTVGTQLEGVTPWGLFRFDFMIKGDRTLVVECDGAEFHRNGRHDEWRDAATLGAGLATSVYRYPGWAITYHPVDCLFHMALRDPWVFGGRGLNILNAEASDEIAELARGREDAGMLVVGYRNMPNFAGLFYWNSTLKQRQFWRVLYAFLERHPGLPLDEVIGAWDREHSRVKS